MQTSKGFLGQLWGKIARINSFPQTNVRTYKVVIYKEPKNLRTENNQPLTQHETTHVVIVTDDFKSGLGILTSAKKPKPGFTPTVIDTINYKGENKCQSIAPFNTPRIFIPEIVEENPEITQYITKKEAMLDEILSTVKKMKPIKIVHKSEFDSPKDDEIFTKNIK